jgi:hypothetical protein
MKIKSSKVLWNSIVLFVVLIIIGSAFFFFKANETLINKEILSVNGEIITESQIKDTIKEVLRDYGRDGISNTSEEKAREDAIEKLKRTIVVSQYLEEKKVSLSSEEIDLLYNQIISEKEGVETKKDYFQLMSLEGFTEEELERNIVIEGRYQKRIENISKGMEITEEELEAYGDIKNYVKDEITAIMPFFNFEVSEETLKEEIKKAKAKDFVDKEIEEKIEKAEIVYF